MRKMRVAASIAAVSLFAVSCGSDDKAAETTAAAAATTAAAPAESEAAPVESEAAPVETDAAPVETEVQDTVEQTAQGDLEIAVITHSDGGVFWSVFEKGAKKACEDLGVTCRVLGSVNDVTVQAGMIDQAVTDGVAGIASSIPNADALKAPLAAAAEAGIPVVTTNSGSDVYKELGAFTHIGQDEFIAGQGAGERFKAAGKTKLLCVMQEADNGGLTARCDGAADTFGSIETIVTSGDASGKQMAEIKAKLESDPSIDAVFGTGPVVGHDAVLAAAELGRDDIMIGSVDLSPDILEDIAAGTAAFTIDQQQYLQGYVSVLALFLNATNQNTLGGGLPINTGPGFVTTDNAAAVAELVAAGSR